MRYLELLPHPLLAPHVRCYWFLEGPSTGFGADLAPDPVLPDGRPELVLNLGDPARHRPAKGPPRLQPPTVLVGQITGPFAFEPCGSIHFVGVRFTPAGAFALFGLPMHEITDAFVDAGALWPSIGELAERLLEMRSPLERASCLDSKLLDRLAGRRGKASAVGAAARLIEETSGNFTIDRLAGAVGLSPRQLARRFRVEVGIGPKRLSRIVRLQALLCHVTGDEAMPLAKAAVECGYYDQAHLIRDFRELVGASPTAFLAQQHPLAHLFTEARLSDDAVIASALEGPPTAHGNASAETD